MIAILGTARFPAENVEKALSAVKALMPQVHAEDGCIEYRFAEDLLDKGLIHISELWRDDDALAAHIGQPHMAPWDATAKALGLHDVKLRVFDVAGERSLTL